MVPTNIRFGNQLITCPFPLALKQNFTQLVHPIFLLCDCVYCTIRDENFVYFYILLLCTLQEENFIYICDPFLCKCEITETQVDGRIASLINLIHILSDFMKRSEFVHVRSTQYLYVIFVQFWKTMIIYPTHVCKEGRESSNLISLQRARNWLHT